MSALFGIPAQLRRDLRRFILTFLALLALQTPLSAQFTGTWTGKYQSIDCGIAISGQVAITMLQNGSNIAGVVTAEFNFDGGLCQPLAQPITLQLPMSGTASGNSMDGTFLSPNGDKGPHAISFSATVSGNTLTFQGKPPDGDLTATMTQTSSTPPDPGASGSYSGNYTFVEGEPQCKNLTSITSSGVMSGALTQAGSRVGGVLVMNGPKDVTIDPAGNCTQTTGPDQPLQISGQLDGTTFSGLMFGGDKEFPWTGTLSGGTLTGTVGDSQSGSQLSFTVSRTTSTPPPSIASFTADPPTISAGGNSRLSWATLNAASVSINRNVGNKPVSGATLVSPIATTTYTLTATGPGGTATAKVTVTVAATPAGPNVVVTDFPDGMLQAAGSPLPNDRFTVTNFGGTSTTVNLGQTATFYTQRPATFTLAPHSSQVVFISATQQPAGRCEGITTISGNGFTSVSVHVHLLVGDAPSSPATITVPVNRSDLTGPVGQNPSGAVSFTNPSNSTIVGIVVAHVPWIIVPSPGLTLGPGETKQVAFSIDRTKRPDAASGVMGGASGRLTYRYINTATGKATVLGTTVTSNVSVSIVDVVTAGASAGTPPALAPGELAYFITGASSKFGFGDLALSNQSDGSIPDLKMYFAQAGTTSGLVSSIGELGSNAGISFPNVVKNIFQSASATGALQLRSMQMSQISAGQSETRSTLGQSYVTALPVFRSDQGFASGAAIFLPGVQKTSTLSTTLYLQEMSGNSATVTTDFFDAGGTSLGHRTDALTPFGSLEIPNAVPAGAVTARVLNTTQGTSSINAYALVIDAFTNDAFSVVQIDQETDPMFCSAFAAATGSRELTLNLTNASDSPITVTVTTVSGGPRRRAVSQSTTRALAAAPSTLTIPPLAYQQVKVADTGFVRLSGSTSLRVTGAFSAPRNGGTIGTGLTVLPTSSALSGTDSRRFVGIDDASAADIAAARPSTYRNNLMLVETSGRPVTVRLTLRYVFSAGVTVSAGSISSADFDVAAGGFVLVNDIVSAVIGADRANYGSLHNAILDVQVVGGSGSVIPFLQVIDNGTGDVTVGQ